MKFALDQHAHLSSVIHRWDPRLKLIGFLALIFAFSFIRDLNLLPSMVLVTVIIFILSKLPVPYILERLRYPSFFLLFIIFLLPFISGSDVILSIGPLDVHREGAESALIIAVRFFCILTMGLVLFSTAPLVTSIRAMRALGLPSILADMTLLTFRYLFDIGNYLHQMETALRLRGFNARRLSLKGIGTLSWLGGSILVRSYERSEWIYKAMIMRGYGSYGKISDDEFQIDAHDIMLICIFTMIASAFILTQLLI